MGDRLSNVLADPALSRLRRRLIWVGWIELVAVVALGIVFLAPGTGGDPAGAALGQGILMLTVLVLCVFVGPALWLAYLGR